MAFELPDGVVLCFAHATDPDICHWTRDTWQASPERCDLCDDPAPAAPTCQDDASQQE